MNFFGTLLCQGILELDATLRRISDGLWMSYGSSKSRPRVDRQIVSQINLPSRSFVSFPLEPPIHHSSSLLQGFSYLYLTTEDYRKVNQLNAVRVELVEDSDLGPHYKILDIFGKEHGIGVENLQGSAAIAGETSRAYEDIITISLVSCRSIGIGAYLVRLGQRVIQVESSHIILTGAHALNKLLGKEVYTSNNQLGGPQIMYTNGVSHITVPNDFEGIYNILVWLSFMPKVCSFRNMM